MFCAIFNFQTRSRVLQRRLLPGNCDFCFIHTFQPASAERSLSHKGCPYDNAVAEATFKIIKTEFVWNETFHTQEELKIKLWDYVNWYNHHRIHSSLGYQTPVQYRKNNLKKFV